MCKRDKGSLLGGAACTSGQKPHHCRIRVLGMTSGNALYRDWASGGGAGDGGGLCWDGQRGLQGLSRIRVKTERAGRTSVGMPDVSRHLEVDK